MVKVFFSKNNQAKVTIPLQIAKAMRLKHGTKINFIFNGKTWELEIEENNGNQKPS